MSEIETLEATIAELAATIEALTQERAEVQRRLTAAETAHRAARCRHAEAVSRAELGCFEHHRHWWAVTAVEGRWAQVVRLGAADVRHDGRVVVQRSSWTVDRTTGMEKGARASSWRTPSPVLPPDVLAEQITAFLVRQAAVTP